MSGQTSQQCMNDFQSEQESTTVNENYSYTTQKVKNRFSSIKEINDEHISEENEDEDEFNERDELFNPKNSHPFNTTKKTNNNSILVSLNERDESFNPKHTHPFNSTRKTNNLSKKGSNNMDDIVADGVDNIDQINDSDLL